MPAPTLLSISCSRCWRSSSSSSRSTASRRNSERRRWRRSASITTPLLRIEEQSDGRGQGTPGIGLRVELPATRACQRVELCLAIVLGGAPLGPDPAAPLQPVQRRIERALLDAQRILRDLLNAIGDRPPVLRLEGERLEDQEIESPLRQIEFRRTGHAACLSPSASTRA